MALDNTDKREIEKIVRKEIKEKLVNKLLKIYKLFYNSSTIYNFFCVQFE